MSEEKVNDILSGYRERITERKIARLSKRIRRAKYVMLLIMILSLVAFGVILNYGYTDYLMISIAGAFLLLFFISNSRPFIALTIAAILDLGTTIYRFINAFNDSPHGNVEAEIIFRRTMIAVILHLVFIAYLILGAIAAKKFEAIEDKAIS